MPLWFACTLVCDAEGCENSQEAFAEYRPVDGLGQFIRLNGIPDFRVRYDKAMGFGFDWEIGNGIVACSQVCHERVLEQRKRDRDAVTKSEAP